MFFNLFAEYFFTEKWRMWCIGLKAIISMNIRTAP